MMRGMSRLAMGAALAVSLSLTLVIAILLLLLLANLFFALRRSRHQTADSPTPTASTTEDPQSASLSLRSYRLPFYAHGVLQAPTSLLLSAPKLEAATAPPPPRHVPKHAGCITTSPVEAKNVLVSAPSPPCPYRVSSDSDRYIFISNPIFDGGACQLTEYSGCCTTPYETPETSPSHLGMEEEEEGSQFGVEEEEGGAESEYSPPLTLMKKLPPALPGTVAAAATSEGRGSLATSASATETNRASFSSSCTLSSSPSR